MNNIIPDTSAVHALLYNDEMDVYRTITDKDEFGIVKDERTLVMEKVKCKLSMYTLSREDNPGDESVYYRKANSIVKIFCSLDHTVIQGDWIDVFRKQKDGTMQLYFKGLSNKPNRHLSHQEVEIAEREVN